MAELSEQDKQEISDFFAENKWLKGVCLSVEESFRAVAAEIWAQANKIDQLQAENEELKLKTDADMTKPQPCTKFCDEPPMLWAAKLTEEASEVFRASVMLGVAIDRYVGEEEVRYAKRRLAEELTDVIHVCVSWLNAEGWDEEARGELHRYVNEKNKARGYF